MLDRDTLEGDLVACAVSGEAHTVDLALPTTTLGQPGGRDAACPTTGSLWWAHRKPCFPAMYSTGVAGPITCALARCPCCMCCEERDPHGGCVAVKSSGHNRVQLCPDHSLPAAEGGGGWVRFFSGLCGLCVWAQPGAFTMTPGTAWAAQQHVWVTMGAVDLDRSGLIRGPGSLCFLLRV